MYRILFKNPLWKKWFLRFLLPVGIIVGWEILSIVLNNPFILPSIESVLEVLLHPFTDILGNGSLFDNAMISLGRVIRRISCRCSACHPAWYWHGTVRDCF